MEPGRREGNNRLLLTAPHTDDGEFGCGGTIIRFIEQGWEVTYAAFSLCEESVGGSKILQKELEAACAVMGVQNVVTYGFPVRRFNEHRQEILEELIALRKDIEPHVVICPSTFDHHQDHEVMRAEVFRAFKDRTIYGYEMPWNNIGFRKDIFVPLTGSQIDTKIKAMSCYKTQARRPYASEGFIKSQASVHGSVIFTEYAEVLENIRCVW